MNITNNIDNKGQISDHHRQIQRLMKGKFLLFQFARSICADTIAYKLLRAVLAGVSADNLAKETAVDNELLWNKLLEIRYNLATWETIGKVVPEFDTDDTEVMITILSSGIDSPQTLTRALDKMLLSFGSDDEQSPVKDQVMPAHDAAETSGVLNLIIESFECLIPARPLAAGASAASSSKALRVGGDSPKVLVGLKDEQSGAIFSIAIVPFNDKKRVELASSRHDLLAVADHLSWMGREIKLKREQNHVFLDLNPGQARSYCFHAAKDKGRGGTVCRLFTKTG